MTRRPGSIEWHSATRARVTNPLMGPEKLGRLSSAQRFRDCFHHIERIEYGDVADAQEHPEKKST